MKPAFPLIVALVVPALQAQSGGQAELAVQGYYLRTGSQLSSGLTGVNFRFEEFLPSAGLLSGNLSGYRSDGGLEPADNYLRFHGLIRQGLRWDFDAGDFRAPATLLPNPFTNLFFPEINARGIEISASDANRSFSLFYGGETLLAGPRIPFRISIPQRILGASARRKFGRFEIGSRLLLLHNTARDPSQDSSFPAGRDFGSAANLTLYTTYTFNDHLRWYSEVTAARVNSADQTPDPAPLSYFFGPAWESPRLTVRVNYAHLTRSYFPLAGFWVGDREGPYGEIRIKPLSRVELFASANQYKTTSKAEDRLPLMKTDAESVGASFEMPLQFSFVAQLSSATFHSSDPTRDGTQDVSDRQWTAALSRRFGPQTVRVTARDTRLVANGMASREKSGELEDMVQIGHVVIGGGVRAQQSAGTERRNAVYARGSAQINAGPFSAFGLYESGKDLANHTVFSTNSINSAIVGVTLRVNRRWSVQAEAFRSRLMSEINPESQFVQGNQNLALDPVLNRFNQWSFLFRVSRTFGWGAALPPMGLDQFTARRIPITGSVEGVVWVLNATGRQPAEEVTIALESGRSAVTDRQGRYRFDGVAEGEHIATLDMEALPAHYNPGPNAKARVVIGPRKVARADFEVYSLGGIAGTVTARPGSGFESLEGIVVRLEPGDRYTTTSRDGGFAFYNVPEGAYQVRIDPKTLPPDAVIAGPDARPVEMRSGTAGSAVVLEIERKAAARERPTRRVFDNVQKSPDEPPEPPRRIPPKVLDQKPR